MLFPEDLSHFFLVFRVGVGVKKADGNGSNTESAYPSRNQNSLRSIKGFQNRPIIHDSLPDLESVSPRDQGRQTLDLKIVQLRPVLAPDLQNISKARSCDKRGLRNVSRQNGVRGERCRVNDGSNKTEIGRASCREREYR